MLGLRSNFAATAIASPDRLPGRGAEEITADAYAQEHHCALWDALAREKAP
jgi:hypothetical protein